MDYKLKFEDFLDKMQGLLDNAKKQGHIIVRVEDLENTFPELAESEDEKIRKELIIWLKNSDGQVYPIDRYNAAIAWLEKQGQPMEINPTEFDLRLNRLLKQFETLPKEELVSSLSFYLNVVQNNGTYKSDEKTSEEAIQYLKENHSPSEISDFQAAMNIAVAKADEPKFKVGDWVIIECGEIAQIKEIKKDSRGIERYYIEWTNGMKTDCVSYFADEGFRLWSIQHVKDGDVLYCKNNGIEYIVMNKGINESGNIDSYFRYNSFSGFDIDVPSVLSAACDNITPATKEQCDTLFAKMKEAGYEWLDKERKLVKVTL